jgi:hypothetical protein
MSLLLRWAIASGVLSALVGNVQVCPTLDERLHDLGDARGRDGRVQCGVAGRVRPVDVEPARKQQLDRRHGFPRAFPGS